ncbi:unnamed protein product [Ectocarpus sp. 4 AP-2014]
MQKINGGPWWQPPAYSMPWKTNKKSMIPSRGAGQKYAASSVCISLAQLRNRGHTTSKKKIETQNKQGQGKRTTYEGPKAPTPAYDAGGIRVGVSPTRHLQPVLHSRMSF